MFSFALRSTYSQYKEDTDAVASWLAKTARNCGYSGELLNNLKTEEVPTGPVEQSMPKAKAKKKAKQQTNATPAPSRKKYHLVSTAAFTSLAKFIAESKNPTVKAPDTFTQTLNRAISLRKDFARSLASQNALRHTAIKSHFHFVRVLEEVKKILMGPTAPSADKEHSSPLTESLAGLALGEPPADSEPEFKADQFEDPNELYLAFKLLVEDVHNIRKAVGQIWVGFKGGKYRSVAAALATNTAIDFARRLEQDISGVLEKYGGFEKIYQGWWLAVCSSYGYDVDHRERPGDDMNFLAYEDADTVMFPTYHLLMSFLPVVQDDPEMIPIRKPGHLGKVDHFGDWNSKAPWKKYQSDKVLLLEVLGSLTAVIRLAGDKEKGLLAEDELIRGLRIAIETRELSLWNVLSAQLLLDIHHILREHVVRPFRELKAVGEHLSQSIKKHLASSVDHPRWPSSNDMALREIFKLVQDWVMGDRVKERIQGAGSPASPEEHYHFKHNPVFCGLFQYTLQMRFHVVGVDFANARNVILYARHLYNALNQEKILKKKWADMELLTMIQPDETAFGSKAPKDRKNFLKRYAIMDGASAASYPPHVYGLIQRSSSGLKGIKPLVPLARVFMHRYCEGSGRVDFTPDELKKILEKTITYEEDNDTNEIGKGPWGPVKGTLFSMSKPDQDQLRDRAQTLRRLTIPELLERLSNALMGETGTHEFHFDYLYMHFTAWLMLQTAKNACDAHLQQMFGPDYLQHEYELPGIVGYLLFALANPENVGTDSFVDKKTGKLMSVPFSRVAQAWDHVVDDSPRAVGRLVTQQLEGRYQLFASLKS